MLTILSLLDQFGTFKQTDGIYILVSKADLFPPGVDPVQYAGDFLNSNYMAFINNCKNIKQKYKGEFEIKAYPYSIGNLTLKSTYVYERDYTWAKKMISPSSSRLSPGCQKNYAGSISLARAAGASSASGGETSSSNSSASNSSASSATTASAGASVDYPCKCDAANSRIIQEMLDEVHAKHTGAELDYIEGCTCPFCKIRLVTCYACGGVCLNEAEEEEEECV
jgi:hypothetical protein